MGRIVLRASRLIDGTGSEPIDNGVIIIDGDRIVAAGRGEAVAEAGRPGDAIERTFTGCTILPGLMDAHVHLVRAPGPTRPTT